MIEILNVHELDLSASRDQVAVLMASLASDRDRLWPRQWWPARRFDCPFEVGAVDGRGPIRYMIESYISGESVVFRFTAPRGFHGTPAYYLEPIDNTYTWLRHVLKTRISGPALLSWPLVYRPLHDALIEDSLDVAAANLHGREPARRQWSWQVRFLRGLLRRSQQRRY